MIAVTGTAANIPASPAASSSSATRCRAAPLGVVVQALAFVLVIVASAMMPAPVRAAGVARPPRPSVSHSRARRRPSQEVSQ